MRRPRRGLRSVIVFTVSFVVLATSVAIAVVAYGVVRSDANAFRSADGSKDYQHASDIGQVEVQLRQAVSQYAARHPKSATPDGLTQYLQHDLKLTFLTVFDPLHPSEACPYQPCWLAIPPAAKSTALLHTGLVGGAQLVQIGGDGGIPWIAVTPLAKTAGDGHLMLLGASGYYGAAIPNDNELWQRISIVVAAGVALAILAGLVIAFSVRRPLKRIAAATRQFGEGDLTARAPTKGSEELGQLGEAFNVMAQRLGTTLDELHASQDTQRRFVADVSHELRTPLSTMVATLTALDAASPADRHRSAELLADQTRRLARLVDDLLEISRFDAGEADLSMELVDLAALVRDAARDVAPDVEIPITGTALCLVDPRRMHAVVRNLINNAIRHGVPPVTVEIDSGAGDGVRLHIIDQGPGIPQDRQESIFGRFTRGDPARSGGTGLGLAIARENLRLHHATLVVSHTAPTCFTVHFSAPTLTADGSD
ncbi:HAMP domain-containing sensor histidine kinase [Jatrophihabitans sp.]|uniref:HAMP domain-containing sensor histidine kinase n=1 Tax=Jatrophihabitans sp. TaxID=1932789 RepID=UPI0030C72D1F|nr:mtrB [Jatrophihabitans sp.]